jgi:hypothetical protein
VAKTLSEATTPIQNHDSSSFQNIFRVKYLAGFSAGAGSGMDPALNKTTDMPDAQIKPAAFLFSERGHGFFLAFQLLGVGQIRTGS